MNRSMKAEVHHITELQPMITRKPKPNPCCGFGLTLRAEDISQDSKLNTRQIKTKDKSISDFE